MLFKHQNRPLGKIDTQFSIGLHPGIVAIIS